MNRLWKVHTASVQTFTGPGPEGDTYAAAVPIVGFLDDGVEINQTASTGDVIEGKARFYAEPSDDATFAPESLVTVRGRTFQVVKARVREAGGMFSAVEHLEVELQ